MADLSIEEIIAGIKPSVRTVAICLRGDLNEAVEDARGRYLAAVADDRTNDSIVTTAAPILEELRALEAEAEAAEVSFKVQAIGDRPWRRLIAQHPPESEPERWRWNQLTFPPAALAASAVAPTMSNEQAVELAEKLSNAQWEKLFGAVLAVNCGDDLVPKSASGTAQTPA